MLPFFYPLLFRIRQHVVLKMNLDGRCRFHTSRVGSGCSVLRRIRQSPRVIAGAHIPDMMPGPHQLANIVPTYRVTFKMSPRISSYVIITQICYVNLARMTKDKKI